MRSVLVLAPLVLSLLACKTPASPAPEGPADAPQAESSPAPAGSEAEAAPDARVDTTPNSAAPLVRFADAIAKIELHDGERVVGELDAEVLAQVSETLRTADPEAMCASLSATSPPWPGRWVWIHVEGREQPFVASIVAGGELRLNARDPHSLSLADEEGELDFDNICDVGYSELLFDAASEVFGPSATKDYQRMSLPRPEPSERDT